MTETRQGRELLKQAPSSGPGEPLPNPYPFASAPPFPKVIGTQPAGLPRHACMGLNSCKGADRYGMKGHFDDATQSFKTNDCAGQGYCATSYDHTCHVQNSCKNQGGCGLYGDPKEMLNPGHNDCRSLGSCATPINAERFSTTGPNRRKSVWKRARKVFEDVVWPSTRAELLAQQAAGTLHVDCVLPEHPGAAPKEFGDNGPSYLWVSDNNIDRNNMTACGSSGTSGAGGCS